MSQTEPTAATDNGRVSSLIDYNAFDAVLSRWEHIRESGDPMAWPLETYLSRTFPDWQIRVSLVRDRLRAVVLAKGETLLVLPLRWRISTLPASHRPVKAFDAALAASIIGTAPMAMIEMLLTEDPVPPDGPARAPTPRAVKALTLLAIEALTLAAPEADQPQIRTLLALRDHAPARGYTRET